MRRVRHVAAISPSFLIPSALVVTASNAVRKRLTPLAKELAADVHEAGDGAEALAIALACRPALVLMELCIPRIDGCTLCKMLRTEPSTHNAILIVVTSSASVVESGYCRGLGANEVFAEPWMPALVRASAVELIIQSGVASAAHPASARQESHDVSNPAEHRMLSRTFERGRTTTPPEPPPTLRCPSCRKSLVYRYSDIGGVTATFPEQWDYLDCPTCGTLEYRHRTRRLRKI